MKRRLKNDENIIYSNVEFINRNENNAHKSNPSQKNKRKRKGKRENSFNASPTKEHHYEALNNSCKHHHKVPK